MRNIMIFILIIGILIVSAPLFAVSVKNSEMKTAEKWVKKSFIPPAITEPIKPDTQKKSIEVIANYDYTTLNSKNGDPLYIGDKLYSKGIYCHAPSNLKVTLPKCIVRITAEIGLYAKSGGGSVTFSIEDEKGVIFTSPEMTQESGALPIDAEMRGDNTFYLKIDPGADIACDQSIWGEICAYAADGTKYDLGDLKYIEANEYIERPASGLPFSFWYNGIFSETLIGSWMYSQETNKIDENRTENIQSWTDPNTELTVSCRRIDYSDFPVSEWTLYFKNEGKANTAQISNIKALDLEIEREGKKDFVLHHADGSPCTAYDYRPHTSIISSERKLRLHTDGGRGSSTAMPYFNIENGKGGIIAVLGWAGQWYCDFAEKEGVLRIAGGMEDSDFYLKPGEEVRSPLGLVMHYSGDWERAQNIWRQFMTSYNMPKNAKPALSACSSHWFREMADAAASDQIEFIRRYQEEKIPINYWWMDAGWYPCYDNSPEGSSWLNTGTWEPDYKRFPNGLKEVSDYAHAHEVNIITWFEPECIRDPNSWLGKNHPDWLLGGALLDLSRDDVFQWLINHISDTIENQGIDLYRQDFGMEPLNYWREKDGKNRKGITEMKHIANYYKYFDALQEKFPGMIIDTCASGGRRNDIETLRRAVPLHRSDYLHEPVGTQNHTYGINYWIPFDGHCCSLTDIYNLRSIAVNIFNCLWDVRRKDIDYDLIRKFVTEHQNNVAPYLDGDYYALTPYSLGNDIWTVFQFHKPDIGKGVILAYRRDECPFDAVTVKLKDLKKDRTYILTDTDTGETWNITGKKLMEGFEIVRPKGHTSVIINFEIKKK